MLKINENVTLKELEKFGFRLENDLSNEREMIISVQEKYQKLCIDLSDSTIFLYEPFNSNTFFIKCDVLYDLIKADLVEKVED